MMLIALMLVLNAQPDDPVCDDEATCREACSAGNLLQCQALADFIVEDQLPQAKALYEKACGKGLIRSCAKLAFRLEESPTRTKADHTRALKLGEQACAGNDALGCANLAVWLWDDGPATVARAAVIAEKACKLKDFYACSTLANMYMDGAGVTKDMKKGGELYDQACTAGAQTACTMLGIALIEGTTGTVDLKRAAKLFGQACDNNYAGGCFQLASVTRRGVGMRRDRKKAQVFLDKACELGMQKACPAEEEDTDDAVDADAEAADGPTP